MHGLELDLDFDKICNACPACCNCCCLWCHALHSGGHQLFLMTAHTNDDIHDDECHEAVKSVTWRYRNLSLFIYLLW